MIPLPAGPGSDPPTKPAAGVGGGRRWAMLALGTAAGLDWGVAVPLVVVTMVTVADNGLAFTAVAERAGPFWAGRALGLQNTAQYLTPPQCRPSPRWRSPTGAMR